MCLISCPYILLTAHMGMSCWLCDCIVRHVVLLSYFPFDSSSFWAKKKMIGVFLCDGIIPVLFCFLKDQSMSVFLQCHALCEDQILFSCGQFRLPMVYISCVMHHKLD